MDLSVNDPSAAVPVSVTIPSGQLFAAFSVSTFPVVDDRVVTIRATADGLVKTKQITVERPRLSVVQLSPSSFAGGEQVQGTVRLTGSAPVGGIAVALSSSDAAVTVPAFVTVEAGKSEVTFDVTVRPVTTNKDVQISATHRGQSLSGTFRLEKTVLKDLLFSTSECIGGDTVQLVVSLNGPAPESGMVVNLSSSHGAVSVPSSVTVPAGERSITLDLNISAVAVDTAVTLIGTGNAGEASASILVNRPELTSLLMSPKSVTGGLDAAVIVRLTGIAPVGGTTVSLTSDNAAAQVPAFVIVPEGKSEVLVKVTTIAVGTDSEVYVSASNENESSCKCFASILLLCCWI